MGAIVIQTRLDCKIGTHEYHMGLPTALPDLLAYPYSLQQMGYSTLQFTHTYMLIQYIG